MAKFIHSIMQPNVSISADGEVSYDLPVNPLSVILLHINPLNETSTLTNYAALFGLLSAVDNIRVSHRGSSVIDLTGADLAAFLLLSSRMRIAQSNRRNTDDERRSLVLPIPLGRTPYDPAECFPETKRGELQIAVTWDIADTGFDGLNISIETIELPDANPSHFQRLTTQSQTFAATGNQDVDLPIGNILRGLLCFGTTGYTGAAPAPSWGELRLLVDNSEYEYSSTDFETSRAIAALTGKSVISTPDDFHYYNGAEAGAADTPGSELTASVPENYTYLDLDPLSNDDYALNTVGAGRVHLRANAETADAVRVVVVEKIDAAEFIKT